MLVRPDTQVLQALDRLKNHPDWDTIKQYLEEERRIVLEKLGESVNEIVLRQLQGRSALLKEFLDLADSPDAVLNKREAPVRLSAHLY